MEFDYIRISQLLETKKISTISPSLKLKTDDIQSEGNTAVVSQDQDFIIGYTDLIDQKLVNYPYVVFGDHTEILKYIDFPFAQGADGIKIFKTNDKYIDSKFLYYSLKSCYYPTGFYQRHFKLLKKTYIPNLSLNHQKRLASVLNNYDCLIENNKRRIRLLDEIGASIYKKCILNYNFMKTPFGVFPDGWKQVNLFDVADVTYGFPFKSELFTEEESDVPVVRIRDIPDNSSKTYTSEKCENKYLIKKNDLLVGMDGIFHMCLWNGSRAYLNQRVARIVSKNQNMCNYFLFLSIKDQIKFWEQTLCGTTVSHLGDKHLKRVTVLVPEKNTLCTINSVLTKIMDEKTNLLNQNQNLIIQRDCFLARLMSGKLSVEGKEIV